MPNFTEFSAHLSRRLKVSYCDPSSYVRRASSGLDGLTLKRPSNICNNYQNLVCSCSVAKQLSLGDVKELNQY